MTFKQSHIAKYLSLIALLLLIPACTISGTMSDAALDAEASSTETEMDNGHGAFPMTLTHDFGEVTFEKAPERIVVMSISYLEMAIALDVPVVGVGNLGLPPTDDGGVPPVPHIDKPVLGEPTYLADFNPSSEVIFGLNPDLIMRDALGVEAGTEDPDHELMSDVAPTLSYSSSISEPGAWVDVMRDFARLMGKSEQAEAVIAEYEANAAALVEEAAPLLEAAPEITMLYGGPDNVGMVSNKFAIGGLVETLGFTLVVPDGVEFNPGGIVNISPEILSEIEADTIIMWKFNPEAPILGENLLDVVGIPVATLFPVNGVGFTGPISEIFYMTAILEGLQAVER